MSRITEAMRRAGSGSSALPAAMTRDDIAESIELFGDSDGPGRAAAAAHDLPSDVRLRSTAEADHSAELDLKLAGDVSAPAPVPRVTLRHDLSMATSECLVSSRHMSAPASEQFRRLATTLHHAQIERGLKVIVVTSGLPSEGKTVTATNLAITLSESFHRRVLLIDADLRRPALHDLLGMPNVRGLADGLKVDGKLSLTAVSPWLSVLPAGRPDPDPVSGISSDRMRQIIEEAAAHFDWVIIDTPPVGELSDATLLLRHADGALLVIRNGLTPYQAVQRAVDALGKERILGVVLNHVDAAELGHYGSYPYRDRYRRSGVADASTPGPDL